MPRCLGGSVDSESTLSSISQHRVAVRVAASAVALVGLAGVLGWSLGASWLTGVIPGATPMPPITALGLLLASAALGLLVSPPSVWGRRLAVFCALAVTSTGGLILVRHWPGWDLGIETVLVNLLVAATPASTAVRMAPTAAVCFMLVGLALLLLASGRRPYLAQSLALTAWLTAAVAAIGYLYSAENLYRVALHAPMAVNTSIAFLVLTSGILVARADAGWMVFLAGNRTGSAMARRVLPIIVVVPVAIGWLRLLAERAGGIDAETGVALMATTSVATMCILLLLTARGLNVADDARRAAEESNARLASIVEGSVDPIIGTAPDHTITSWNLGAEHLYGYASDEVIGRPFSMLVDPESQESSDSVQDRALAEGRLQHLTRVHVAKDGRRLIVAASLSPIRDERDSVVGISYLIRDITEQTAVEKELKQIEWMLSGGPSDASTEGGPPECPGQGYGDLTELNRDGIIRRSVDAEILAGIAGDCMRLLGTSSAIYERSGDYAYGIFSSGWCRLMDRSSRALCDTRDDRAALDSGKWLCHESCWTDCSKQAIATRVPVDIECNGGIRLYAVPIFADGEVIGSINFGYGDPPREPARLQELSESYRVDRGTLAREAEAYDSRPPYIVNLARERLQTSAATIGLLVERRIAEGKLQEANEELESFAYSVSHDLRAPLRHISGFADLLERTTGAQLDERGRHYLTAISESAAEMGTLIDDLLSFSRMGRAPLSLDHLNLEDMVNEYVARVDEGTRERGIEWVIGELPAVHADRAMMRQVFANLLGNAVKYTRPREKPRIEVGAYPDDGEIVVFVRDNGAGFDMAYADKLFSVFQRLHSSAEFEGTGIGLANVRRIISRHGGRTWAKGTVDQGATFHFSLPSRGTEHRPAGNEGKEET